MMKCRYWMVMIVCALCSVLIATSVSAAEAPAAPVATASPTAEQAENKTLEGMFGKDTRSDYVAKHFSLIFGGVILNPFKLSKIEPSPAPTPAADGDETEADDSTRFKLDTGSTDVKAFLEGGVRYRWAWLDRKPFCSFEEGEEYLWLTPETIKAQEQLEEAAKEAERDVQRIAAAKGTVEAARDVAAVGGSGVAARRSGLSEAERNLQAALDKANDKLFLAQNAADNNRVRLRAAAKAACIQAWKVANEGTPVQLICSRWVRQPSQTTISPFEEDWDLKWAGSRCLLPGDFQARVGFVFDGGSPAGISGVASSDNVYGDLIAGMNLLRASLPTNRPDETPIRASLNLEGLVSLASETKDVDVHGRYMIGLGGAIGVPLTRLTWEKKSRPAEPGNGATTADTPQDDGKTEDWTATESEGGVVEFVARLGATRIDVPHFVSDDSREVEVANETARFDGEWGLGIDLEMNIPITENAGYITARSYLTEFVRPSPWGIQIGYTIPLSSMLQGLGVGR